MNRLGLLTHANSIDIVTKQHSKIYVDLDLLGMWWHSPGNKCTHVMLSGGGMAPVLETPEEISKLKLGLDSVQPDATNTQETQGKKN